MSNITLNIQELGNKYEDVRATCWGNSYSWDFERNLSQVVKLAIHHSVTNPQGKTGKQQVDEIGEIHKNRGWAGYGYHLIIDTNGKVWYVGDIGTGRANIANHNEKIIGICLIGDFTKHLPTASQIHSTHILTKFFLFNYPSLPNVTKWEDVIGHKEAVSLWGNTTATACPGTNWKGVSDSLYERIKNDKWQGYSPPEPVLTPPGDPCEAIKKELETTKAQKDSALSQVETFKNQLQIAEDKLNKIRTIL